MNAFLFRFRGELLGLWGLLALGACWPPRGCPASVASLLAGLALRAWARRHIGPHSRSRVLSCPERSTRGPYRYVAHPLYLANLLVATALALVLAGPTPMALAWMAGPVCLYALLARAENRVVAQAGSPDRTVPHDLATGGWRSEWASFVPPLLAWGFLQWIALR